MTLNRSKLAEGDLTTSLAASDGWTIEDGMLARTFSFPSYKEGLVFAVAVGWEADKLDHHPDLLIGYQKVRVATVTHDAGGLTDFDFELARRVNVLKGKG